MTNKFNLSTAAVHRLIRKAGARRVGDDAIEELQKVLEEIAIRIAKEAMELATHARRKTVRAEDIQFALKSLKERELK